MWFSSLKTMFSCSAHTAPTLACIADGIETLPRFFFQHLTFLVIGDFFILPCFFQTTRGFLGDSIEWLSNKDFLDAGDPRAHLPDWPLSNQCHLCHFSQVIVIFCYKLIINNFLLKILFEVTCQPFFLVLSSLLAWTPVRRPFIHPTQIYTR